MTISSSLRTAADILHWWTILRLCVKADAASGCLCHSGYPVNCSGLFYGQCLEICYINWGKTTSDTPSIKCTIQFTDPVIKVGMIINKIIINAWVQKK